jgi:hypothetical protein
MTQSGAICRNCNNTGIGIFDRQPCACQAGREKAKHMNVAELTVVLYAQINALHEENDRLREIAQAVADLDARESFETPLGKRDIVLHSDDLNVLWVREQARNALKINGAK